MDLTNYSLVQRLIIIISCQSKMQGPADQQKALDAQRAKVQKTRCRSKEDLYHILETRLGFYLPNVKEKCVSTKWLLFVLKGRVFCPRVDDIRKRLCPIKPTKKDAFQALTALS
jgi:hypothetical protein